MPTLQSWATFLSSFLSLVNAFQLGRSPYGWSSSGNSFQVRGSTGVAAMQLAVVTNKKIIIIDKIEPNLLKKNGQPVWAAEYDIASGKPRALTLKTNSFCAVGSWLRDGTFISLGGDPYSKYGGTNGLQSIRTFKPCDNGKCQISENPSKNMMIRPRWYPSATRLQDGTILIMGGKSDPNRYAYENTIEYYPRKGNNVLASPFLTEATSWNLFPHAILLPDGRVFVAANNQAMIYDWKKNREQRLPNFPGNLRTTYPFGSASALLPLKPSNGYTATVLLCGGSDIVRNQEITTETPAVDKCFRMELTPAGIAQGWQIEDAPGPRLMGNLILTPDGKVVYINGAGAGSAGFYNTRQKDGSFSSATAPQLTPYLYDPDAPAGLRWSSLGVSSQIPRMYHSVATLLPDARILVAGSNPTPNSDRARQNPFPTEYRVETLNPSWFGRARPSYTGLPAKISYKKSFNLTMKIPSGLDRSQIIVSLHDLGFSTHGVDYNARAVHLNYKLSGSRLTVTGPSGSTIYPPGPAWLYVVVGGVPSQGLKVMVG